MKPGPNNILKMALGILVALVLMVVMSEAKKDERECEVCVSVITKFTQELTDDMYGDTARLETAFRSFCKRAPKGGKENRFCYYLGGTEDAATGVVGKLINPLSYHLPVVKICEKLKTVDSQICEMRFDVKPDFTKLNKMKVGELKKILSNWGEDMACKGCAEKSEFVKKVRELLPKYEPEEWKKVQAAEKSDL